MAFVWNQNKLKFNHHQNIPPSFRMLIVGSSGCGKTQLLFKMLLTPGFLDYDNLIIFSKTVYQEEYQILYHGFKNGLSKESIIKIFEEQDMFHKDLTIKEICELYTERFPEKCNNSITVTMESKCEKIMNPSDLNKTKKNLIIFDDCVTEKNQEIMSAYYTRGRHNNCNSIYLSQSWFDLPKKTIRNNSNFIILFKLNKRDKDLIYSDLFSNTLEKEDFTFIINKQWNTKYKYIAFDREEDQILDDVFMIYEEQNV